MAKYKISVKESVYKDINSIPPAWIKKILSSIDKLSSDPRGRNSIKLKGSESDYRMRCGDYRVIYKILEKEKAVEVFKIRHRKDIYR
jgi:mRNA interferase RelE/StbE